MLADADVLPVAVTEMLLVGVYVFSFDKVAVISALLLFSLHVTAALDIVLIEFAGEVVNSSVHVDGVPVVVRSVVMLLIVTSPSVALTAPTQANKRTQATARIPAIFSSFMI